MFEHCIIKNSNYGIFIENGSADILNCRFERNSLCGIVVKNSEVLIDRSVFTGGHVLAVNLQPGARVRADSLIIVENITGIACQNKSSLVLKDGSISGNANGIVAASGSSISITAARISRNKNGVIAAVEIPKRTREMVFGNSIDVKISPESEIDKILKEPESVKSIVLPQASSAIVKQDGFTAGFSALSASQEPAASLIGNVTAGFSYFVPESRKHPIDDTLAQQTHYPEGIQPEVQVFASGRRGAADINLLMDLYGNKWLSTEGYVGKNIFNLSLAYAHQAIVIGDFFESGSETSISGRQMTGLKYDGSFWEMGGGNKRLAFKLAAGESEIPKDYGDHQLNIYNEVVDSGMLVRQQITYVAALSFKPTQNSSFSAKGIISRDQVDKPLFRPPVTDSSLKPIQAQTGSLDGSVDLLRGQLKLYTELDLGTHDTIVDSNEIKEVAWYNPRVEDAVPKVFSMFNREDFTSHYAFTLGAKTSLGGYNFDLSGIQISPHYYSAGNPYLEADRRIATLAVEKQFKENLSASGDYSFERTSVSDNPFDRNTLNMRGEYRLGEGKPAFSADYTARFEKGILTERVEHNDTSYSTTYEDKSLNNVIGLEGKQTLQNGIAYSLRYQFLWDNDISRHADESLRDEGDRFQHQMNGWFSFKVKKVLRNKVSLRVAARNENKDSLQSLSGKINDQVTITLIPRKLSLSLAGEYNYKKESEYSEENSAWLNPVYTKFYYGEIEAKYSITSRISVSAKGKYEKSYDETIGSRENYTAAIGGLHLTYLF